MAALLSCAVTIRLGIWQLDRLAQRQEINFQLASRVVTESINLPGPISHMPPAGEALRALEFRPVVLRGFWDFTRERALPNQFWERQLGLSLLTPLVLEDGTGAVLVDRGWVPAAAASPSEWERFRPSPRAALAAVEVRGYVRLGTGNVTLTQIRRQVESEGLTLLPFHVQEAPPLSALAVTHQQPGTREAGAQGVREWGEGQPLPYRRPPVANIGEGVHAIAAAQWFIISAIIAVGTVVYVIQRERPKSPSQTARGVLPPRLAQEHAAAPGLPKGR
ncbi:MAG: SURF1 family protein [Chloroflexota bacterium]